MQNDPALFREASLHVLQDASLHRFLKSGTQHFSDARLSAITKIPEWEQLRQRSHEIRKHTLEHLDEYLAELESRITSRGGHVHWAPNANSACEYICQVASRNAVQVAVKSKSTVTEEIGLRQQLADRGVEVVETDMGEFVVQLAGEAPFHILAPAMHKNRHQVAELFSRKLGVAASADISELNQIARGVLRDKFATAGMGISGVNFAVAETGTIVILENEGNARLCTSLPSVHVAVMGIEKVVPRLTDLEILLRMLPRAATGQKISSYISFLSGPASSDEQGGPKEFHLVLVDNGRTRILADEHTRSTLYCIRCGACANVCPVYSNVGGHAYGGAYSGPIGAILVPQLLGLERAPDLPFASSLCGACSDVCPVKIPIPEVLLHLRRQINSSAEIHGPQKKRIATKRLLMRLWAAVMKNERLYGLAGIAFGRFIRCFVRHGSIRTAPGPLKEWTRTRDFPVPPKKPFRALWKEVQ